MMAHKKWSILFLVMTILFLVFAGGIIVVIDPFFHYHAPLNGLEYPINDEPHRQQRYQNNGMAKHFDYDALIIGTSMAECFKTSDCDKFFGVNSIKVPYAGASFKEINGAVERAIKANSELKIVIRALDYSRLGNDKDTMAYESYPEYLWDDCLFNDVNYIFNKTVLFGDTWRVVAYTMDGNKTPSFDEYSNYGEGVSGKEVVNVSYERRNEKKKMRAVTEADYIRAEENVMQNLTDIAEKNPQVEFYYFLSPYSIYYWDSLKQSGELEVQLAIEKEAIEIMLEYDNIHLFSFFDNYELICNPDNYRDYLHYTKDINTKILEWMSNGEHKITKDNYEHYCDSIYEFYTNYNYDGLFE